MVGVARTLVKVFVVLALAATACFWRDFDGRVAMHTDLLVAIGRKGVDLAVAGRLTAADLAELLYPLSRGRAFAEKARRRLGDEPPPPGLVPFEALLGDYATLCDLVDRERRTHGGPVPLDVLEGQLAAMEARAATVHATLARGD